MLQDQGLTKKSKSINPVDSTDYYYFVVVKDFAGRITVKEIEDNQGAIVPQSMIPSFVIYDIQSVINDIQDETLSDWVIEFSREFNNLTI